MHVLQSHARQLQPGLQDADQEPKKQPDRDNQEEHEVPREDAIAAHVVTEVSGADGLLEVGGPEDAVAAKKEAELQEALQNEERHVARDAGWHGG
jgi:hypothetical protein